MSNFMGHQDIIRNKSPQDKGTLRGWYDKWQQFFQAIGNDFGNEFVSDIIETNEPKITSMGRIFLLGIKTIFVQFNLIRNTPLSKAWRIALVIDSPNICQYFW